MKSVAHFADAATLFNVLSSEKRLEILHLVHDREVCVGDIAYAVNLSQSAVSQHLSKMRSSEMVQVRRESQTAHYRASGTLFDAVLEFAMSLGSGE